MRHISVSALLALLIAVTILPPLAFSVILIQQNNDAQQEVVSTLAEATAGSFVETLERQLQGMRTSLNVLSTIGALEDDELRDFHARGRVALADSDQELLVVDENGNQILNTRTAFGSSLPPLSEPAPVLEAIETGETVVSNAYYDETARSWRFNVSMPRLGEDGAQEALVLTQNVDSLSGTLTGQNLRGGWNAVITDREGIVAASTFLSSDVGQPFFLDELMSPDRPGPRQTMTLDGERYETTTKRSQLSGWSVIVWAPSATIERNLVQSLRALVIGGLVMIAIGTAAAWLLGRQISKPLRQLSRDADHLGAGEDVQEADFPVTEIATVSAALAKASQDRKNAENEIRFLMREVAHRSKNQLTVVSSIAKQTARNSRSFAAFEERFQERIQGLARSTDLLMAGGVAGVELSELMQAQIEPFRPADEKRLQISGPRFRLSHQAAQTIGLALHELATNASKYGAFQIQSGSLAVTWKRSAGNLVINWREYVPRLRKKAERRGFGSEMIERMLGGALDAQIERNMHANGVEYSFTIPVERLIQDLQQ